MSEEYGLARRPKEILQTQLNCLRLEAKNLNVILI